MEPPVCLLDRHSGEAPNIAIRQLRRVSNRQIANDRWFRAVAAGRQLPGVLRVSEFPLSI
jgi:hypothetical protein